MRSILAAVLLAIPLAACEAPTEGGVDSFWGGLFGDDSSQLDEGAQPDENTPFNGTDQTLWAVGAALGTLLSLRAFPNKVIGRMVLGKKDNEALKKGKEAAA